MKRRYLLIGPVLIALVVVLWQSPVGAGARASLREWLRESELIPNPGVDYRI